MITENNLELDNNEDTKCQNLYHVVKSDPSMKI